MKRSGNIGASKNLDSVFADFTDDELEQDLIFDEDDQLVEIVEGYTEDGNTVFEEDEEIFNIAHQVAEEDDAKPEEVVKNAEELLGPDNKTDEDIKGIENVEKIELDDSQTIENLEKNGESEAEKELNLDKLEDEYHSSATVEETYNNWLNSLNEAEGDTAEGTDDKFGKDIDDSLPTDDLKANGDEAYNATNDAMVEEAVEYITSVCESVKIPQDMKLDTPDLLSDAAFKKKFDALIKYLIDNNATAKQLSKTVYMYYYALVGAAFGTKNVASHGMTVTYLAKYINKYCDTKQKSRIKKDMDKTIKAIDKLEEKGKITQLQKDWRKDITKASSIISVSIKEDAEMGTCDCGKEDCPVCSAKVVAVSTKEPTADEEKHEESNGDPVAAGAGEGLPAPGEVNDNTFPEPENMTPEGSPETDNGDITDDDNTSVEEAFEKWLNEEFEGDENKAEGTDDKFGKEIDNSLPEEDPKVDGDEAYNATNDASVDEAFEKWLNEADADLELPLDNGETPMLPEDDKTEHEELEKSAPETSASECGAANVPTSNATVTAEMEAFEKWLNEAEGDTEETEAPTKKDIEDAAEVEAEDTETELDDDLAAVADDDSDEGDVDLEYDPSDEELIDIAGGVD